LLIRPQHGNRPSTKSRRGTARIYDTMMSGSASTVSEFQQFGLAQSLLVHDASGSYVANPDAMSLPTEGVVPAPENIGGPIWKAVVCAAAIAGWIASVAGMIAMCATLVLCLAGIALHVAATIGVIDGCMMGW
ncbi:MAG: hypothetical protein WBS54_11945, partial [Acidobacteriota bacterium]